MTHPNSQDVYVGKKIVFRSRINSGDWLWEVGVVENVEQEKVDVKFDRGGHFSFTHKQAQSLLPWFDVGEEVVACLENEGFQYGKIEYSEINPMPYAHVRLDSNNLLYGFSKFDLRNIRRRTKHPIASQAPTYNPRQLLIEATATRQQSMSWELFANETRSKVRKQLMLTEREWPRCKCHGKEKVLTEEKRDNTLCVYIDCGE